MTATRLTLLTALLACAGEVEPEGPRTLSTDDGLYQLTLEIHPDPPQAGEAELTVDIRADGQPVEATLTVEPWMPSMGHGIAEPAAVHAAGDGRHEVTFVFNMPGTWELRLGVDGPAGADDAVAVYEVQ